MNKSTNFPGLEDVTAMTSEGIVWAWSIVLGIALVAGLLYVIYRALGGHLFSAVVTIAFGLIVIAGSWAFLA